MAQKFANAARSPLMANILAADTSLTVDAALADLFPVATTGTDPAPTVGKDFFKVVLENALHEKEIVYVRTRALGAATFSNVLRGQEGTTARAYTAGDVVGLRHTASDLASAIDLAANATTAGKALLNAATAAAQRAVLGLSGAMTSCRGLLGVQNAATPLTKFDLSADSVTVKNGSGELITVNTVTTKTCDFGLTGPAANGRDQAGAFTAGSWVNLFFVYNATTSTMAVVASAAAASSAPTLPTGYTHYAYATSIRWNGSSNIVPCYARGNWVAYQNPAQSLSGGTAIVETAISFATVVPPDALRYSLFMFQSNGAGGQTMTLRLVTGVNFTVSAVISNGYAERDVITPNVGQSIIYMMSAATDAGYLTVMGYVVPNGDA